MLPVETAWSYGTPENHTQRTWLTQVPLLGFLSSCFFGGPAQHHIAWTSCYTCVMCLWILPACKKLKNWCFLLIFSQARTILLIAGLNVYNGTPAFSGNLLCAFAGQQQYPSSDKIFINPLSLSDKEDFDSIVILHLVKTLFPFPSAY